VRGQDERPRMLYCSREADSLLAEADMVADTAWGWGFLGESK
jgi:hypothetical protein